MRSIIDAIIISLNIFKFPFGHWVYLNALAPLMGLVDFIKRPGYLRIYWPLVFMIIVNAMLCIAIKDWGSVIRLGQFFCLLCFSRYLINWINEDRLIDVLTYATYFTLSAVIIEYIFFFNYGELKEIFGIKIHRTQGPVGESNFSAIICSSLFMLSWLNRKWVLCLINILCILSFVSKTALILSILFIFSIFLIKKYPKLWERCLYLGFFLLGLTPLLIYGFSLFSDREIFRFVENLITGRLVIWRVYLDMGIQNAFGVGYMNGWGRMSEYLKPYLELQSSLRAVQVNEQHNFFIHIWSEFGWFGYLFFSYFFYQLVKKVRVAGVTYLNLVFFLFLGYSFLNGLSDFVLYLILSVSLLEAKKVTGLDEIVMFNGWNFGVRR